MSKYGETICLGPGLSIEVDRYGKLRKILAADVDDNHVVVDVSDLDAGWEDKLDAVWRRTQRRIYLASSWRNEYQPMVVRVLRGLGHEVYDFRNPPDQGPPATVTEGFSWKSLGKGDPTFWTPSEYRDVLSLPKAEEGYTADKNAMDWADMCVLLLPSGRSAHAEAFWMAGKGKEVFILFPDNTEDFEPELMYKLLGSPEDHIFTNLGELVRALR